MNTYWRHCNIEGHVRTLLSKKGRAYRTAAAGELLAQNVVYAGFRGPVAIHLDACPPDRRKRDLDNLPKSLLDALTHARVWSDDSQVDDLRITRGPVVKGGIVNVTITTLKP